MDPDRWEKIQQIVSLARKRGPPKRDSFLKKACAGDPELRKEVDSFLENWSAGGSFLETPAMEVAARRIADERVEIPTLRLAGRMLRHYRILDHIGAGGMGVVYRARDEHLQRDVAVKVLPPGSLNDSSARRRFKTEALALARLNHPNIEAVYDFDTQDEIDFLAMEYIAGVPLNRKLAAGKLSEKETTALGLQLAEGLTAAQAQGIVHRDLKPSNLLVTPEGRLKILDFGLAKLLSGSRLETTDTRGACGTLLYMSPEQLNGSDVDHRSDIYSAGTVLFEMATGKLPFQQPVSAALIQDILHTPPPAPRSLSPEISPRLEEMILKCLEKDPENRYQSAKELLVDFRRLSAPSMPQLVPAPPAPAKLGRLLLAALAGIAALGFVLFRWNGLGGASALPEYDPFQVTRAPGSQGQPSISPDGNLIAYASDERGNFDIFITDPLGNSPHRLTDGAEDEREPAWFPDGSAIVFTRVRGIERDLWRTNLPGGGETRVVSNGFDAAVSPDGRSVAFCRSQSNWVARVCVAPLGEPEKAKPLTDDRGGEGDHLNPVWSPDGSQICYATRHGLWMVPAAGGTAVRLSPDAEYDLEPVWPSGGRWLYFGSYRGTRLAIWRMGIWERRPQRITAGMALERHPSVSRDGRRLVYASDTAAYQVLLLESQSGRQVPVAGPGTDFMASISRDGRRLVFASNRGAEHINLWAQDLDGTALSGSPQKLTDNLDNASQPVFSPDGRWIAYYRIRGDKRDIWIVPGAGGQQTQVTFHQGSDIQPAWSPDGSALAFASSRDGRQHVWVVPVKDGRASGEPRLLTPGEVQAVAPAWSPDGRTVAFTGVVGLRAEVWVVAADGRSSPRQITAGADVRRVAWDAATGEILASGSGGGESMVLWRVSPQAHERKLYMPRVEFGGKNALGTFDVSRDGQLLVYTRDVAASGHVWILEAKSGSF